MSFFGSGLIPSLF